MKLLGMIKLVLWSFFGVRNSKAHATDLANANFTMLPFVAIILAVLVGAVIYGVVPGRRSDRDDAGVLSNLPLPMNRERANVPAPVSGRMTGAQRRR